MAETIGEELRLEGLSVGDGSRGLDRIDAVVRAGECLAVLGPTGAGKTTLLAAVAGFLAPRLGRIVVGGRDVTDLPPETRPSLRLGPDPVLFPGLDAVDQVAFGLLARGLPRDEARARGRDLLARVGLTAAPAARPDHLDDLDRRRVALARALAVRPAVLLLDEPFAGLDPTPRHRLAEEWSALRHDLGLTLVAACADPGDALRLADRIAALDHGRVHQIDTAHRLTADPATLVVADLFGARNRFAGTVTALDGERAEVATALGRLRGRARPGLAVGAAALVVVEPHHLHFADDISGRRLDHRFTADLVGRRIEGPLLTLTFDHAAGRARLTEIADGGAPHLAGVHDLGFSSDRALVFPDPAAGAAP